MALNKNSKKRTDYHTPLHFGRVEGQRTISKLPNKIDAKLPKSWYGQWILKKIRLSVSDKLEKRAYGLWQIMVSRYALLIFLVLLGAGIQKTIGQVTDEQQREIYAQQSKVLLATADKAYSDLINFENIEEVGSYITNNIDNWNQSVITLIIEKLQEKEHSYLVKAVEYEESALKHEGVSSQAIEFERQERELEDEFREKASYIDDIMGKLEAKYDRLKQQRELDRDLDNAEAVQNIDKAFFADIITNPKFAGKITPKTTPDLAKELAKEIFIKFSPEFQQAFNDMHLRLEVKKYENPAKIKVYIVYGISGDGKETEVKFMDSRWKDLELFIFNTKEFGTVLAQRITKDGTKLMQQIREKNGEIEKIVVEENGNIRGKMKVQKFPNLTTAN